MKVKACVVHAAFIAIEVKPDSRVTVTLDCFNTDTTVVRGRSGGAGLEDECNMTVKVALVREIMQEYVAEVRKSLDVLARTKSNAKKKQSIEWSKVV